MMIPAVIAGYARSRLQFARSGKFTDMHPDGIVPILQAILYRSTSRKDDI